MKSDYDLRQFRITTAHQLDFDDLGSFPTKLRGLSDRDGDKLLSAEASRMEVLQEMLYASKSIGFLIAIQALDAAGKDSLVKHALSGLNVVGSRAVSFKAPTKEELQEGFLDRHTRALPKVGEVGIWVRSHYEELIAVRVHPEYLKGRGIDPKTADSSFWKGRQGEIREWEKRVRDHDHIPMVKIFLNASDQERLERLLERTNNAEKYWKVGSGDAAEFDYLPQYRAAIEDAINTTSTKDSPWYVIPADDKDEAHVIAAQVVNYELERQNLHYPVYIGARLKEIDRLREEIKERLKKL